jgi:hypothetical protein
MMASVLVTVAEAVKDELALGSFVRTIAPERSYADWDEELTDAGLLHVDVVPVRVADTQLAARGELQYSCEVDIGVRYRFSQEEREQYSGRVSVAEVDALVDLVEQFHEYFTDADNAGRRLSTYTAATWQATDIRASYSRDMLRTLGQFTGVVRVTYEVCVSQ